MKNNVSQNNMLIVHGGAPTAVINASLYGAIVEAKKSGVVDCIYGAQGGSGAILEKKFINLTNISDEQLELLPFTPASAIGTSRKPITEEEYEKIVHILYEYNIRYVLFNGGNGSMDACGKIAAAVKKMDKDIFVVGIPKTIDNDIAVTDHSPGFGSAARYFASSIKELAFDIASLPIHVCIIEAMGRNSGWLTAASVLGKVDESYGPHLLYVPEKPFIEEEFFEDVKKAHERYGGVLIVTGEGLKDVDGKPIVLPVFQTGRSVYYGDVSAHLCTRIIQKLHIKARSEKPGILGRCSIAHQSSLDREEAICAGQEAVRAALAENSAVMVGFKRISNMPYVCEIFLIPVESVMLHEKVLDESYIVKNGNGITSSFVQWCTPLIGGALAPFAMLTKEL